MDNQNWTMNDPWYGLDIGLHGPVAQTVCLVISYEYVCMYANLSTKQ